MNIVHRYLLITAGVISVFIGILGVVLPILPGTPFFILALACFDRSSPAFHQRLLNFPYIGEQLRHWEKEKKIEKKRKKQIYLIVIITFFLSILSVAIFPKDIPYFHETYQLQLLLIGIMLIILYFISKIDEK